MHKKDILAWAGVAILAALLFPPVERGGPFKFIFSSRFSFEQVSFSWLFIEFLVIGLFSVVAYKHFSDDSKKQEFVKIILPLWLGFCIIVFIIGVFRLFFRLFS